jgi:HlyD family secretion protein
MLIGSAGLSEVRAGAAGRLAEVSVRTGDLVRSGDVIASISQPDQDERIKRLRARVNELEGRAASVDSLSSRGLALNDSAFARRREFLNKQIEVAKSRADIENNQIDTLRQLAAQRLATRRSVEDAERSHASAVLAVEALRRQLGDLERERTDVIKRETDEKSQVSLEMSEAKRELSLLEAERARATTVKSAFAGRVVEIKSGRGSLVSVDSPVVVLERTGDAGGTVEVVMYVASNDGKKIHTGAMAEILPATARRDEHGFLVGTVHYVSDYPATPQALLATLGSEELVKDLIAVAAPFEVRIRLERRNDGFRWTRGGIDAPALHSGTLCSGNVFVRRERPIGFVIPALRKEST